jgi:hypothetical protein
VPRIKHTDCRIRGAGRHRDLASKLVVGMCQARPPLHRQPDAATMIVCARHVTSVTLKKLWLGSVRGAPSRRGAAGTGFAGKMDETLTPIMEAILEERFHFRMVLPA